MDSETASRELESPPIKTEPPRSERGSAFWFCIVAVMICSFLSALDTTAVSTALPTITDELNGGDKFVWVGTAFTLASTAIMPFTGRLADALGRRPVMMGCITFFFVGSAVAGSAKSMDTLIAARALQGVGAGGIFNLTSIIISDLVPLAERAVFQGLLGLTWACAAAIGPVIGGALAEKASWRWLFYINLPLCGIAFAIVFFYLKVKSPPGTMREKLSRIDLIGNLIIIAGTTLALIALTWGGVQYPWSSPHVLAPLIIGFVLIIAFFVYETIVPEEPSLPIDILTNRVSLGGYLSNFFHGIVSLAIIFYIPVYFQACKDASPIRSGVMSFGMAAVISPMAIICGIVIKVTKKYLPVLYLGWALILIGTGLLTLLKADASPGQWIGFQVITAAGIGLIWAGIVFPILAPLPVTRNASALAFYNFSRTFAQACAAWGITISATILQNQLKKRLPADFVALFPQGVEIAYAAIPVIHTLKQPLKAEVQDAFATSMAVVWKAMIGFAAAGFATMFLLREIPMQTAVDTKYGLKNGGKSQDEATVVETSPSESSQKLDAGAIVQRVGDPEK